MNININMNMNMNMSINIYVYIDTSNQSKMPAIKTRKPLLLFFPFHNNAEALGAYRASCLMTRWLSFPMCIQLFHLSISHLSTIPKLLRAAIADKLYCDCFLKLFFEYLKIEGGLPTGTSYKYNHTHAYTHTHTHTCMNACVFTCILILCTYTHTNMHTFVCSCIHSHPDHPDTTSLLSTSSGKKIWEDLVLKFVTLITDVKVAPEITRSALDLLGDSTCTYTYTHIHIHMLIYFICSHSCIHMSLIYQSFVTSMYCIGRT